MVIYLPGDSGSNSTALDELTPREIVEELDKHVVGQGEAKRAVAVALRNRIRRQRLEPEMAEEVMPKNILMMGPTGVGKTEVARRLARLSNSPFVKVEATKFTEVGYVGRDVDSMIRDLVEMAIDMIRDQKIEQVTERAEKNAEERLLQILMPPQKSDDQDAKDKTAATREKLRQKLRDGKLDDRMVEIDLQSRNNPIEVVTSQGVEEMDINIRELVPGLFGGQTRRRKMNVLDALDTLTQEEEQKLIDMEQITRMAVERTEQAGIVFLDEMDKIAGREGGRGPEVSREGVQRDLLPIVEGTTVNTRYGMIRTDHILFIAAGAFHVAKPSDMIPEKMQGRFPIRVELKSLTKDDFVRILTEPKNALTKQYIALLDTEGLKLEFTDDAINEIARTAMSVNEQTEDIGARRLHTIMEKLLEKISFEAPDMRESSVTIDVAYVNEQLASIAKDQDLSRYIL